MNKFWDRHHLDSASYWLTGSSVTSIENFHNINFSNYKNKSILEIGVGTGSLAKILQKYTKNLSCADISSYALKKVEHCAETYLTDQLINIEPVDLAVCHLVFQHCNDEEVARIINDVQLKDSGVFSFQYAYYRGAVKDFSDKNVIPNETHFFRSPKDMRNIINNSNKEIIGNPIIKTFSDFNWEIIKVQNAKN